jgi:hypothetical protein
MMRKRLPKNHSPGVARIRWISAAFYLFEVFLDAPLAQTNNAVHVYVRLPIARNDILAQATPMAVRLLIGFFVTLLVSFGFAWTWDRLFHSARAAE